MAPVTPRQLKSQKWTIDTTSLVSFGLLAVAKGIVPVSGFAALLGSEALFAAFAAARYPKHNAPPKPAPAPVRRLRLRSNRKSSQPSPSSSFTFSLPIALSRKRSGSGSSFSNRLIRKPSADHTPGSNKHQQRQSTAPPHRLSRQGSKDPQAKRSPSLPSASPFPSPFSSPSSQCMREALAARLLDPREGHLSVLTGGELLAAWFQGLDGPHQLQPAHLQTLMAYYVWPVASSPGDALATLSSLSSLASLSSLSSVSSLASFDGLDDEEACLAAAHSAGSSSSRSSKASGMRKKRSSKEKVNSKSSSGKGDAAGAGADIPLECPRVRSWAGHLAELLRLPHADAIRAGIATDTAAAAAVVGTDSESDTDEVLLQQQPAQHAQQQGEQKQEAAGGGVARLMACQVDPVRASYRPLSFYLIMEALAGWTHCQLTGMGFTAVDLPGGTATVYEWCPEANAGKYEYGSEVEEGQQDETEPLVFMHGIGVGLAPYLPMLGRILKATGGRRRVYALQFRHVSMRLCASIPEPHEVAADVAAFLTSRHVSSFALMAHSYGTFVASALNKLLLPNGEAAAAAAAGLSISRLTLVDPVAFAMFLPHLVRSAIYRNPVEKARQQQQQQLVGAAPEAQQQGEEQQGGWFGAPLAHAVVSKGKQLVERWCNLDAVVLDEYHVSVALRRRLNWATCNLWPSELPSRSTLVLGAQDHLVPVEEVQQILNTRAQLLGPEHAHQQPQVLLHPEHGHGGFVGDVRWQGKVLAAALGLPEERMELIVKQEAREEEARKAEEEAKKEAVKRSVAEAGRTAVAAVRGLWSRCFGGADAAGAGAAQGGDEPVRSPFAAVAAVQEEQLLQEVMAGALVWQRCVVDGRGCGEEQLASGVPHNELAPVAGSYGVGSRVVRAQATAPGAKAGAGEGCVGGRGAVLRGGWVKGPRAVAGCAGVVRGTGAQATRTSRLVSRLARVW